MGVSILLVHDMTHDQLFTNSPCHSEQRAVQGPKGEGAGGSARLALAGSPDVMGRSDRRHERSLSSSLERES
jgi:hypothetical protein